MRVAALIGVCVVAVAAVLVVLWWFLAGGAGEQGFRFPVPPCPPRGELVLGRKVPMPPEGPGGGRSHDDLLLQADADDVWYITKSTHSLHYARYNGTSWSALQPVKTPGWQWIGSVSAVVDSRVRPVVFWTGSDSQTGSALAVATWLGNEWSQPVVLDRLESFCSYGSIDSIVDTAGNIHVAYDRPLTPREKYNLGGHGAYPDKCFHAFFDGQRWSEAAATTGKGRFGVDNPLLSNGPAGRVCLSLVVGPFSGGQDPDFVAVQMWDGKRWSKPERLTPKGTNLYTYGAVIADQWGTRITCWNSPDGAPGGCMLSRWGQPQPFQKLSCWPRVAAHASGRTALFCQKAVGVRVRLWNGREWTRDLECPSGAVMIPSPCGRIRLSKRLWDAAFLQEIILQEAAPAAQTQPKPQGAG